MNSPVEDHSPKPGSQPAPSNYRLGRLIFIVLMAGSAVVLLASVAFMVFDLVGRPAR